MEHRSEVEMRLDRIESAMDELSARLAAIETGERRVEIAARSAVVPEAEPTLITDDAPDLKHPMALMGRSVLILGGAFVLRALTESAVLPPIAGVVAGLVYAIAWMIIADRAARGGRRGEALFDCATAAAIAYPLVWETTTRFKLMSPAVAGVVLLIVSLILLGVGRRNTLRSVTWLATGAGSAAFLAVAIAAAAPLALMVVATLFAATALIATGRERWFAVAWPAIAGSNLLALGLVAQALMRRSPHSASAVVYGLLLFAAVWFSAIVFRSLAWRSEPTLVEIAQSVEVVLVGVGGAVIAARLLGTSELVPSLFALTAGLALVAVAAVAAQRGLFELSMTCSGVGSFSVLFGSFMLFGREASSILWALIAVVAAVVARRLTSTLIVVQCVVWLAAATLAAAIPALLVRALAVGAEPSRLTIASVVVALLAGVSYAGLRGVAGARAARIVALTAIVAEALTILMTLGSTYVPVTTPVYVALIGTIVLAATAAALASVNVVLLPEAGIVARAVLAVGGAKLVVQDIRLSSALVLVVAFAIYGFAMLIVSRTGSAALPPAEEEGAAPSAAPPKRAPA